jgi:hypothetical protein
LVVTNKINPTYSPATLLPLTVYYWKIVARDSHGAETIGPLLSFTTSSPPNINSVSPNPCQTLQVISIVGEHFGETQGSSKVILGVKVFDANSTKIKMWSDTRIDLKVPAYTWTSGTTETKNLSVKVNGLKSNIVSLTITKP